MPVVRREGNVLVIYLALDEKVTPAWVQIFDDLAWSGFDGFAFKVGNLLPRYSDGPAVAASLDLADTEAAGVIDRIRAATIKLKALVAEADAEDRRRDSLVREIVLFAGEWSGNSPDTITNQSTR